MKSSALPAWMYKSPEAIADGLIAKSKHEQKEAARKAEIHRKHKSRRLKLLVKQAKRRE